MTRRELAPLFAWTRAEYYEHTSRHTSPPAPSAGTYGPAGLDELRVLLRPPEWQKDAACREHPEIEWVPDDGKATEGHRAVCDGCLVQDECLAAGASERGVWGGTSERERVRVRRQPGRKAA